jgi:hypothetical protein
VIRIRRRSSKIPFTRSYEVELSSPDSQEVPTRHLTKTPVRLLEPLLGVGDSWSFVEEADRQWSEGNRGWAVEFEESEPGSDHR